MVTGPGPSYVPPSLTVLRGSPPPPPTLFFCSTVTNPELSTPSAVYTNTHHYHLFCPQTGNVCREMSCPIRTPWAGPAGTGGQRSSPVKPPGDPLCPKGNAVGPSFCPAFAPPLEAPAPLCPSAQWAPRWPFRRSRAPSTAGLGLCAQGRPATSLCPVHRPEHQGFQGKSPCSPAPSPSTQPLGLTC